MNLFQSQLFLDDFWIEDTAYISRVWHQPQKYPEPVLKAEQGWEKWCPVAFGSVLKQSDKFRMWYATSTMQVERVGYAESEDGITWHKPNLGLVEHNGDTNNNIVLQPELGQYSSSSLIDDITIINDVDDKEWPLKALFWQGPQVGAKIEGAGIYLARSCDGIHWDRSPGRVLVGWGDRFNALPTKRDGCYVLYGRAYSQETPIHKSLRKGREVWRVESEDLRMWSTPERVLACDDEDPARMETYSLAPFEYSDIQIGGMERMYKSPDVIDTEIVWSRDEGHTWQRSRARPSFIPHGAENSFDSTWICLPANAPIRHNNRLWFYYSGRNAGHIPARPLNYGAIGLAILRIDGFASLRADADTGVLLTKPMQWPDGDLTINCDARRDLSSDPRICEGELRVEVRDEANQPIEGFMWNDCEVLSCNTLDMPDASTPVAWREGKSLRSLAGRRIRLAFQMRDCHLFSFYAKI